MFHPPNQTLLITPKRCRLNHSIHFTNKKPHHKTTQHNTIIQIPMTSPVVLLLLLTTALTVTGTPTAYEALRTYNFPPGILPIGVTNYELDESSGNFRADLNGSCSFSLQGSYQLSYKSTITGKITENRLTDLRGISVKVMFFWVNILEVVRKGEDLDFSVGVATAAFPLDNFFESPRCGCGLDCDPLRIRKLKLNTKNPYVSSV